MLCTMIHNLIRCMWGYGELRLTRLYFYTLSNVIVTNKHTKYRDVLFIMLPYLRRRLDVRMGHHTYVITECYNNTVKRLYEQHIVTQIHIQYFY